MLCDAETILYRDKLISTNAYQEETAQEAPTAPPPTSETLSANLNNPRSNAFLHISTSTIPPYTGRQLNQRDTHKRNKRGHERKRKNTLPRFHDGNTPCGDEVVPLTPGEVPHDYHEAGEEAG